MTLALKAILLYTILSFSNDVIVQIAKSSKNTILLDLSLRLFTVFEYSLFAIFFYLVIKNATFKKFILGLSVIFYAITLNNYIKNPTASFDSIPVSTESILIIIYCLYYFFEKVNETETTFIYSAYHFWIVIGILIYLAGAFFLFTQADNLSQSDKRAYWIIAVVLNILKNIFFAIAFLTKKSALKNPLSKNRTIS